MWSNQLVIYSATFRVGQPPVTLCMQNKPAGNSPPLNAREPIQLRRLLSRLRSRGAIAVVIFLVAFGVRVLTWHDTRLEVGKVQTAVVADYQRVALLLRQGGVTSFFSRTSPLADLNNLGHPPGYSLVLAVIYSFKQSDTAVQFVQISADALSAVLIFLIVSEFLPLCAGVVAGLMAALSPQLAWNSVLLLPDSLSVLPVLLALFLLARAVKRPRLLKFVLVGAFIGVSCWLRANAMLLTFFVAVAVGFSVWPPQRWRFAFAVICGTLLIVLPLTIRNAVVFHRFIPLSLGAGQTFLEGIADYDKDNRFGIPNTDVGIMKQEAEIYQRPDYYGTLFNPDGVERERARLSRGLAVVRAHPIWFAGVMGKRAISTLRLERSRVLSNEPAVTQSLDRLDQLSSSSTVKPEQATADGTTMPGARVVLDPEQKTFLLVANANKYGEEFAGPAMTVRSSIDYAVVVPVTILVGRMRINIENDAGKVYSSQVIETLEHTSSADQPEQSVKLYFVAAHDDQVRVVWANEAPTTPYSTVRVGSISMFELGPARFLWTRYPRFLIHTLQKLFVTFVFQFLAVIGISIMFFRFRNAFLLILLIVPVYFMSVQSAFHTEYRYLLAVNFSMFAWAAVAISVGGPWLVRKLLRLGRDRFAASA
jgi:Dolichyl-phosphate-mannose-protein mannosyltransferase